MKTFPYRILFLCVFLPPVCYVLTIQGLERYFQKHETSQITQTLIRDMDALLQGRYTVREEITRNLSDYLKNRWLSKVGVRISILVKTKGGLILYPLSPEMGLESNEEKGLNYVEVAAENYRILERGLNLSVTVHVRHNSWLSNSILVCYVLLSLLILQHFIRKGVKVSEALEAQQEQRIRELEEKLQTAKIKLEGVSTKESEYRKKIDALSKEKTELCRDMDGLLEEMEELEKGLEMEKQVKEAIQSEMDQVREELKHLRKLRGKGKKKKREPELIKKRFKVLYKNVIFTDRAVEGFLALPDEFQLKAEEVISKLNQNHSQVQVKRKVFGKGGKMDILETHFSYSGRIYFQRNSSFCVKVLAVGTKNTQSKDLGYLESVSL
ncbi:MAG: hypothetical protein JRH08_10180 [Deltaproteobacteria bacterium]|nr:hypothetical protein [Deltaproteobacteria bacterium]MBW2026698.1 hypothetical protein [Deltaproteobacteria bacterium]MBW2126045.1 hypothetical protein [Deltaproteobacteria bacterium]